MSARPWLCPEGRCTPLLNLRDGDYKDITVPEPGHSFTCWGKMAEPVEFVYDGVEHANDCNACHYTPLKGLIRWQENPTDWETLCTYYGRAAKIAERWPWVRQPGHHGSHFENGCGSYDLERNPETGEVRCAACGATGLTTGVELDNAG